MICSAVGICDDHRLEAREKQRGDIELALLVQLENFLADLVGVLEAKRLHAQLDHLDDLLRILAAELIGALAADAEDLDGLALADQRVDLLTRQANDRRVERAAQAALGGADHQQMDLILAGAGQQLRRGIDVGHRAGDVAEHLLHALRIGPRGLGRGLCAAQLRRRDHLHGLGDLLRRLGRGDADAHVFETGHFVSVALSSLVCHARACPGHLA